LRGSIAGAFALLIAVLENSAAGSGTLKRGMALETLAKIMVFKPDI